MTATKELRELLKEHGIMWKPSAWGADCETYYEVNGLGYLASELGNGRMVVRIEGHPTPEQLVSAIPDVIPEQGTCRRVTDFDGTQFICSECGEHMGPHRWNYCPNCGRRSVE